MKKFMKTKAFLLAYICSSGILFASGVENKTNMSTGYLRNPSRNTEAKRPESSYYNIAGTAFMKNGLFVEVGNQFVFKEYGNEMKGSALGVLGVSDYYSNDTTTVWFYPDADFVYKNDRFAVFGNFGVYAGGGSLSYTEGTSATSLLFGGKAAEYAGQAQQAVDAATQASAAGKAEEAAKYQAIAQKAQGAMSALLSTAKKGGHSLDVTSITYGGQIGLSYKLFENLSFASGLRYVHGTQNMKIKSDYFALLGNEGDSISYKANGYTVSSVFGFHYKPIENIDVSIQYQSKSAVKYEVKDVKGKLANQFGITNGKTFHTDLPAALNIGAGYQVSSNLYLSSSFNYYFNYFANQDSILGETDYDNSWEFAFGADFDINKFVSISAGIQYGRQGTTDDSNSVFNPVLDSLCVGTGVEIHPTEPMTVTLSGLWATYFNTDYYIQGHKIELSKDVFNLSVGFTYHFPNL